MINPLGPDAVRAAPGDHPWTAPCAEHPLDATVDVPGSKSLTNRFLVLSALADGPSMLRGALRSRDTTLMAAALGALGMVVAFDGDAQAGRRPMGPMLDALRALGVRVE